MSNLLQNHDEYHIQDIIDRLENLRCSVGYGQLNDDLRDAIDCLKYAKEALKRERELKNKKESTVPHLIVIDHGFAGQYHRCSRCGKGGWNAIKGDLRECPYCGIALDPNKIEYQF